MPPQRRGRLADHVYGRLLEDIVSGRYEVGDRLPAETELAETFEVSRPVVREALNRLQADGLFDAARKRPRVDASVDRSPSSAGEDRGCWHQRHLDRKARPLPLA